MFYFKQFSVEDSLSPMKVGTDGVLLGTWIPTINNSNTLILDIGTGCGLIALILAQRIENSYIKAIDIDDGAIENAKRNFAESVWNDRLTAMEISIQRFCETSTEKFDIIVSNPPFFEESLKSNKAKRNLARHNDSLPFNTLIQCVNRLMSDDGIFACILPYNEGCKFIELATEQGLYCCKRMPVANKPSQSVKRILFCLSRKKIDVVHSPTLFIRNEDNSYSPEYLDLTRDFYTFI